RRYQPQLCLAQMAVPDPSEPDGVRTELLDPLDGFEPQPIASVLSDTEIEVILHAGRQDIALLRRTLRTEVRGVFDTQVAAGFLGFGTQEGYESLVRKVLGVQLRGSEGFTRWDRRPLTPAQLAYARDDARCLLALGAELTRRLSERGRLAWAREECRSLEHSSDVRDPDRVYERLPRIGRLRADQRAAARALVDWRERTARGIDRPPGFLVSDQSLVELARQLPQSPEELLEIRGLSSQTARRRGAELLDVIARGRSQPPPPPPPEAPRRDPDQAPLVSLAQALVRHRCLHAGVAVDLVATQGELAALVDAARNSGVGQHRVMEGWRRELVGAELEELLSGRLSLRVDGQGALQVSPRP
ncbi:MAG: HRDC domain-containing protein, partial [Actinomycetota bacterium]|nr:HRDC domain-containing protein [Actinomycetota bacterium]